MGLRGAQPRRAGRLIPVTADSRVLLTGATGFVGRATLAAAAERGIAVTAATRHDAIPAGADRSIRIGDLAHEHAWEGVLEDVDAVIHLAARVHVMRDSAADPLTAYRAINVRGTAQLARAAAAAGVRRFIFVSSVKVHGDATPDEAFTSDSPLAPVDSYGRSKVEAEAALSEIAARTALEVIVVRPPLVYGPGVGANFLRLLQLVNRGVPLPLGQVRNRRSLIYVGNLADVLLTAVTSTRRVIGPLLVADGAPVSSPELVCRIARALGRPIRLLPVPPSFLRAAGALTGHSAAVARLLGSLEVDASVAAYALGWTAPVDMNEGLRRTAEWFRSVARP
jgi:nucleoside-diphosphate-sugar epimerase